ncbi:MAG: hypothetical protein QOH95_354 [Gaiellaceae bacterium]|jgi:8-oxo-dGTP pyrophosphatase MutT (NUDIX family)|nr:hypothetical protein [Gaiellaceae bacterium]
MKGRSGKGDVVAAVCYRRENDQVEFLLVKTTGRSKWTFPKGHVKKGEAPAHAAAREAREEAGAIGFVTAEPLSRYVYAGGSDGGGERPVEAYLLAVVAQSEPESGEEFRNPTWFDGEAAKGKFAEGREGEERYVDEHRRVIDEALKRMGAARGR